MKARKDWPSIEKCLKADIAEMDASAQRLRDENENLQIAMKAANARIAELQKANEGLDAERNLLKARVEWFEITALSLSGMLTRSQEARQKAKDWRTPPPAPAAEEVARYTYTRDASMLEGSQWSRQAAEGEGK